MKYPLTFFWPRLIPDHAAACARGPLIFIRPKYREDAGLYQHELVHVKQWAFVTLVSGLLIGAVYLPVLPLAAAVHGLLYMLVPHYCLWCEVQAYRKQLRYYQDDRTLKFARYIATSYGLNITQAEAEKELKNARG